MQRRSLLKLGAASAVVFAVGGAAVGALMPGLVDGRLSPGAREVFAALSRGMLDGSLPEPPSEMDQAVHTLLDRLDQLVGSLPQHAQTELSQLLALLCSGPGRLALTGLRQDWSSSGTAQVQQGLQSMRLSSISLKQQAYLALHDLVGGAYFSQPAAWRRLGYPGPVAI
jgi:hypothetical protein